jgi:hypothetical protein
VLHCVGCDPPCCVAVYVVEVNHPIILAREGGARMPDLEDVTQKFTADTAPYIAALQAAAQAARDFADANDRAAASSGFTAAAVKLLSEAVDSLEQSEMYASDSSEALNLVLREVRDSSADLMMQTALLSEGFAGLNARLDSLIGHAAAANAALNSIGDAMTSLAAKTAVAGAAQQAAQGLWIGGWRITGNMIHWIVAGAAEFLAVAIPAAIALSLGAFVMYQGVVEDVTRRMQALYTATEATSAIFGKTTGDVLGLGHAFQTAQNEANPIAYQLLGNYILVAKQHMTDFASAGLQVADAVRKLGAEIQVDLIQHGAEFTGLLSGMVKDAIEFGQILGNLGHALLNFAAAMPGLAEKLLLIFDAISKVILVISELPPWIITTFMAFEEFNRWGGLVVTLMGRMGLAGTELATGILSPARAIGILRNILQLLPMLLQQAGAGLAAAGAEMGFFGKDVYAAGTALEDFGKGGVAAIGEIGGGFVLAMVAGAVGIGIMIDKLETARDYAQRFGDALEKGIASASNVNALDVITQSIGKMNTQIAQTPQLSEREVQSSGRLAAGMNAANQSVNQLSAAQQQMIGQFNNVADGADKISRAYGMSFTQALGLADVAGVKLATTQITLGKNANVAGAEIESLVQGYKAMDQVGGALGTDMNVLAIQSGLAGTKVSSLNQAMDQFVQNGTSVTGALATMNQDLTQIGNVGVSVGGAFRVFTGTTAIGIDAAAKSLQSFSGTGAQTWQNYNAAINQAQTLTDSFRVAATYGGVSQKQFTGSIADTVASLLPFTTHSATAVSELSMIAQEAGGPATSNFKTLKTWVDQNTISGGAFNKAVEQMTGQLDNAGSAAKVFASDLQTQMQQQMANALLGANNLNGAVKNFQSAVVQAGGHITASSPQYQQLYKMLTAAGLSAQQAKNELQTLQGAIDAMHSKTVTVGVEVAYSQSGAPPPYAPGAAIPLSTLLHAKAGQHGMTVGFAGGGMVGGGSGVDAIHAMLTAGEAVLNAQAVAALGGPMGVHTLNNQPSQGVLTSGGAGAGATALGLNLVIRNEMDGQTVNTNQRQANLIYNRRNPSNNLALRAR